MGKMLLLLVAATSLVAGSVFQSSAHDNVEVADRVLSGQARRTLAREVALSGMADGESRVLPALSQSGAYVGATSVEGTLGSGSFLTTVTNAGLVYTLRAVGTVGAGRSQERFTVIRTYRLDVSGGTPQPLPPAFMRAGVMVGTNLQTSASFTVRAENAAVNANVHANGNIQPTSGPMFVGGFGTYGGTLGINNGQTAADIFQPSSNPTGLPAHSRTAPVTIPAFDPALYASIATRTTNGDFRPSGTLALGTRDAPVIWYVSGNLTTQGDVTFTGYGTVITRGNMTIRHNVTSTPNPTTGESTLGLYSGNNIVVQSGSLTIAGQLFANNDIQTATDTQITGMVTARNNLQTKGTFGVTYRPANESLTRPFWPSEVGPGGPAVRRVVRTSSREWLTVPT